MYLRAFQRNSVALSNSWAAFTVVRENYRIYYGFQLLETHSIRAMYLLHATNMHSIFINKLYGCRNVREWKPMMWENRWNKNKTPQWKKKKKEIFFCISNSTQYIDKTNFGISFRMFYRVSTLTAPHQYGRNMAKDTHQIQFYVNGNSNNNNKIYTQVHRMNNKSYDNQNWYLLSCSWDREYEVDESRGVLMPKIRFFRFSWFSMVILVFLYSFL